MSASEAAAESSSRARQDAEPEAPQRRWVALISNPVILAAEDERARAMAHDTTAELDLHDPPRPSYLVLHPRIVALDPCDFAHQPSAYILAADRSGGLLFRVTKPGSNDPAEDEIMYLCNTHARRATTLPAVPYSDLHVEAQPRHSVGLIADPDPLRCGHYLVTQLCSRPPDSALLGDKLLCYSTAEHQWFVKPLLTSTAMRMRNLRGETGLLAHAGRLYWLALAYGIFVCDPFAEASRLRFVPLPADCEVWEEEELSQINPAYVAPSEGLLRYVDIRGLSYDVPPDVAPPPVNPSVRMWTLVDPEAAESWRFEYEAPFAEVWENESYVAAGLPHWEVPHVAALIDPDGHGVVYFFQGSKLFGLDVGARRVVSCEDCSVRDDREIMLRNSRPILDACELSPPSPPTPSSPDELAVQSSAASYTGLDNGTAAHDAVVARAPMEFGSASAAGVPGSAGKAHDVPFGGQKKDEGDDAVATDMQSRVAIDMETEIALDRANPSVAAKKRTGLSHVAAKNGTGRSHVTAETKLRRPHSNASADSLQGPRRVAHFGREENPVCHGVRGFKTSPARLHRRRGKTRLDDGGPSSLGEISNTVTICLDGKDGKDVLPSYSAGITAILEYCHANGIVEDVSQLFGPEVIEVFTTPPDGTFYLVLEYNNRSLELAIGCRDLYMMGWRGPNGTYEIKSDSQLMNYMAGNDVRLVAARRNYQNLCPNGDVGRTKMGIYEFRTAFDDLYNYRGKSPRSIEEAIGKIAVYISEATRLQGAFDTVCASLKSKQVSRLNKGSFNHLWINRYSRYCAEAMKHINLVKQGKKPPPIRIRDIEIQKVEEILREIRVLHIDAYNDGIFKKEEPRPKVFLEQRSKSMGHNKENKRCRTAEKIRNTKHPANSKGSWPPRRGYTTSSSGSCPQLTPVKDESSVVEPHKLSGGVPALKNLGDEVSEYMKHFPALRRLCKQNYEHQTQMQVRPSLQKLSNSGQGTQCLPELTDKPNRRLQRWDLTPSRHPTPPCCLHKSAKAALVQPEVLAANQSRTINLGTPKTECVVTQKAPIRLAGAFVSKLLRLIRR